MTYGPFDGAPLITPRIFSINENSGIVFAPIKRIAFDRTFTINDNSNRYNDIDYILEHLDDYRKTFINDSQFDIHIEFKSIDKNHADLIITNRALDAIDTYVLKLYGPLLAFIQAKLNKRFKHSTSDTILMLDYLTIHKPTWCD